MEVRVQGLLASAAALDTCASQAYLCVRGLQWSSSYYLVQARQAGWLADGGDDAAAGLCTVTLLAHLPASGLIEGLCPCSVITCLPGDRQLDGWVPVTFTSDINSGVGGWGTSRAIMLASSGLSCFLTVSSFFLGPLGVEDGNGTYV